jgi:valyl-tRNA synthetase
MKTIMDTKNKSLKNQSSLPGSGVNNASIRERIVNGLSEKGVLQPINDIPKFINVIRRLQVIWGIINSVNLFRKTSLKLKLRDEVKKKPLIIKKSGI